MSIFERLFSKIPSGASASEELPPEEGIRLVVGLGNPGPEYEGTRHNIGFELVDRLAKGRALKWSKEHKFRAKIAKGPGGLILAKPLTYMNLSGNAVARIMRQQGLVTDQILIVYDDIALAPGGMKFRPRGSAGGHNGIKSLIEYLGTETFPRLRLGIGPAMESETLTDHVLGRFSEAERLEVEKVLEIAEEGVNCALSSGLEAAMNRFNRKN